MREIQKRDERKKRQRNGMKRISLYRRAEHFLTWNLLKGLMLAFKLLPHRSLLPLSRGMGAATFFVLPRRRKIALDNLKLALGKDTTERQRELILRQSMVNVIYGAIEIVRLAAKEDATKRVPPGDNPVAPTSCRSINRLEAGSTSMPSYILSPDRIDWNGLEHLEDAVKRGKGVILVGSHFGNFPLILVGLRQRGFLVHSIVRNPSNPKVALFFDRLRDRLDLGYIHDKPKERCVRRALECLRANEVLFLQIDLNVITGGVYVDFFGYQVPTFTGPVVFAQRTGATILPIFGIREGGDRHKVFLDAPVELVETGDREADLQANTALLTKILEGQIRRFPEEWWWLHRRWRKARKREEL